MFTKAQASNTRNTDTSAVKSAPELRIAKLAQDLLPLMRRHDLDIRVSEARARSVCVVDTTENPTQAYKIRGALAAVSEAQQLGKQIVITASAGNHGAGVAYAAKLLGLRALIYVPENAPEVKVDKIQRFGATVVKAGSCFDEALALASDDFRLASGEGAFVHPFDDVRVAAGQGTIGLQILEKLHQLSDRSPNERFRIFLPVGGGGLVAGVASTVKSLWNGRGQPPEIVGVIDESSPAALLGTLFGRPVCAIPDTIADGTKVAVIGSTFLSVAHCIDHIMLVQHDEIVAAMRRYERESLVKLEAAGALALAGEAVARKHNLFGDSHVSLHMAVVTGRNIDPATFHREVTNDLRLDLALVARQAFDIEVPEREGELLHFLRTVRSFNIASLTYKQRPGTSSGTVRAEFEVARSEYNQLEKAILRDFPGSRKLIEGEEGLYRIGKPVAREFRDELITLDDTPGSFLRCIEELSVSGSFGAVGFLFYRKPAYVGRQAQVVLGRQKS